MVVASVPAVALQQLVACWRGAEEIQSHESLIRPGVQRARRTHPRKRGSTLHFGLWINLSEIPLNELPILQGVFELRVLEHFIERLRIGTCWKRAVNLTKRPYGCSGTALHG